MSTGLLFCGTGHLIFKVVAQHLPAFLRLKRLEVKTGFMWFQLKALNLKHHNFLVLFSEVFVVKNSKTVLPKSSTQHFYTELHHKSKSTRTRNQRRRPPTSVRTREMNFQMNILKAHVAYRRQMMIASTCLFFFEDLTLKLLKYDDVTVTDVLIPSLSGRKRQNCFIFFPLALSSWGWSGWGDEPETDEIENLDSDLAWS